MSKSQVPVSTTDNLQNVETSILALLSGMHNMAIRRLNFDKLAIADRKHFYKEAVGHVLISPTWNLIAHDASCRVALLYNINIAYCDRAKIQLSIYHQV